MEFLPDNGDNRREQERPSTDEAARTVEMPLRLDHANALPAYPQQTQKQQHEAA